MGTRAIISVDGKWKYATHWDGYPTCLGRNLLEAGSYLEAIEKVALERTVDYASEDRASALNEVRFEDISRKAQDPKYTPEYLRKLWEDENKCLTFGIHTAEDYPIGKIENDGDYGQEYIYDLRGGVWFFKSCYGDDDFKELTEENIKKDEDDDE